MTHRTIRRLISSQLDGEVDGLKDQLVQEHLSRCAECSAYQAGMKALRSDLRSLDPIVPAPDFVAGILRKARIEQEEYKLWSPVELVARRFVTALAAAVLILVSVAMISQPEETVVIDRYLAGEQSDSTAASLLAGDVISNEDLLLAAASRK
jgi:predicted anti-sigma-YlaC factor YlaD